MLSIVLIAFISLILLLILHEFSHFAAAKKFKAEVEEFGIGYPPRLLAKKIGQTVYSLNILPFGAFVKLSDQKLKQLPVWQRAIIIGAGVASFWVICAVLLAVVFWIGSPFQVSDQENGGLLDPRVQIVAVASGSPAEAAGLKAGDIIQQLTINPELEQARYGAGSKQLIIDKVAQVQDFVREYKGQEITLIIKRGEDISEVNIIPRVSSPEGQGAMGIGLARVATKKYAFLSAIGQAVLTTLRLTGRIVLGFFQMAQRAVLGKPTGAELIGPVGMLDIFVSAGVLGPIFFLQTVALISLHAAVANALPIPVVDGGRLMFLALEKIRKKPLNEKIEQSINTICFGLLVALMIWVTIKDVNRLF